MKTSRTALVLAYNIREEVEPGVWEDNLATVAVRAEEEKIWQTRRDRAKADGLAINGRFRIRDVQSTPRLTPDYVCWNGVRYKVASMTSEPTTHYAILEIGELV
jgi:hypothetical protein